MFISREIKIYTVICALILGGLIFFGIQTEAGIQVFIIDCIAVLLIWLSGLYMISMNEKRITKIREAAEQAAVRNKSERIRDSEWSLYDEMPEQFSEGEIGKLAKTISDIIQMLQEAESKEHQEKEFLQDVISDISHQIKTPVASLTVFNDLLLQDLQQTGMTLEKKREILEQSELQLERIKWLVQAMLQLARIEAQSVIFEKEEISAINLLKSCVDVLRMRAESKSQTLLVTGDEANIEVDSEWFKEALVNIIKNAIDYAPENSEICINVRKTPIAVEISVLDHGCGISEEDRLNIFQRFYRVSGSTVNPNSVGIGLALSKSIIEGCGGRIRVESRTKEECTQDQKSYTKMIITL